MLKCISKQNTYNAFVQSHEIGHLSTNEEAHYCMLAFDIANYKDELYTFYSIALPKNIESAVKKRRAEYLAGRLCCKYVLEEMNVRGEVLSKYPDRQPYWPPGVCGSISHTGHTAIATVIREEFGWIGIDIESLDADLLQESRDIFSTAQERDLLKKSTHLSESLALLVTFSSKESIFKALYPQVQSFFGFEYANVVDLKADVIKLKLAYSLSPQHQKGTVFNATYMLGPDKSWVITTVIVNKI